METKKILDTIKKGENQELGLMESFSQLFPKLMIGFANTTGGMIIIGVNSKKEITGVKMDVDELRLAIMASGKAAFPPIVSDVHVHKIKGKDVITVKIPKTDEANFHTFRGTIYARVGTSLRRFEAVQLADFLKKRQLHQDLSEAPDYKKEVKKAEEREKKNGLDEEELIDPDEEQELKRLNELEKKIDKGLISPADRKPEAKRPDELNERQKTCIEFLKKHKSIKTSKYRELNKVSSTIAHSEIKQLLKAGYLKKDSSHRKAHYVLNEEKAKR